METKTAKITISNELGKVFEFESPSEFILLNSSPFPTIYFPTKEIPIHLFVENQNPQIIQPSKDQSKPGEAIPVVDETPAEDTTVTPVPKPEPEITKPVPEVAKPEPEVTKPDADTTTPVDISTPKPSPIKLEANVLSIAWGTDSKYWKWVSNPNSSFGPSMAQLNHVWWLDIKGSVNCEKLTKNIKYEAYLVYDIAQGSAMLDSLNVFVKFEKDDDSLPSKDAKEAQVNLYRDKQERSTDGRFEVKLGEFIIEDKCVGEVKMGLWNHNNYTVKKGLIVHGIDIRPIEDTKSKDGVVVPKPDTTLKPNDKVIVQPVADTNTKLSLIKLEANVLSIAWVSESTYWRWVSKPNSSFGASIAQLNHVWWLDIKGSVKSKNLANNIKYEAYLVYEFAIITDNLNQVNVFVKFEKDGISRRGSEKESQVNLYVDGKKRMDGCMEVKLGEFRIDDGWLGEVKMGLWNHDDYTIKEGLIVHGIEIRQAT